MTAETAWPCFAGVFHSLQRRAQCCSCVDHGTNKLSTKLLLWLFLGLPLSVALSFSLALGFFSQNLNQSIWQGGKKIALLIVWLSTILVIEAQEFIPDAGTIPIQGMEIDRSISSPGGTLSCVGIWTGEVLWIRYSSPFWGLVSVLWTLQAQIQSYTKGS